MHASSIGHCPMACDDIANGQNLVISQRLRTSNACSIELTQESHMKSDQKSAFSIQLYQDYSQSSSPHLFIKHILVYVRVMTKSPDMPTHTPNPTWKSVAILDGFTKFGIVPGGGGSAPRSWGSARETLRGMSGMSKVATAYWTVPETGKISLCQGLLDIR